MNLTIKVSLDLSQFTLPSLVQIIFIHTPCTLVTQGLVAQMVKNLPAMQEKWVQSLEQKDPLEKGMVTHSSIPAWRIPWTEEPSGLQSMGSQRVGHNWATNTFTSDIWPAGLSCKSCRVGFSPPFYLLGREAGGGIGMGNTCKSMTDSCQCMAKTTIIS